MTLDITPIYDVLLRGTSSTPVGVYQLQLTTAEQLTRLHYSPGSLKTIKARLKTLVDNEYLVADVIPSREGRKPYYYTLGVKGAAYLDSLGYDIPRDWQPRSDTGRSHLFIDHTLEVNDILIAAALLPRTHPRHSLHSFIHERVLKRTPFRIKLGTRTYSLIPDAFLDFRYTPSDGGQRRMATLLEHDRGTEGQQHFKDRVRAYISFVKSERYKQAFGTKVITVAFTTFVGVNRLEQMRLWTRQELASSNEDRAVGLTFLFASLPKPPTPDEAFLTDRWYTAYEGQQPPPLLAAS